MRKYNFYIVALLMAIGVQSFAGDVTKEHNSDVMENLSISQQPIEYVTFTVNGVSFEMAKVCGGTFKMGSADKDADRYERPVHTVTLSTYYIGKYEVNQNLWCAVMGDEFNPSEYGGCELPVDHVSRFDCQKFIDKLNELTGKKFRLPTEAQWEFAARGGVNSKGYKYSGSDNIDDVAWCDGQSQAQLFMFGKLSQFHTYKCGGKSPNELGIYDMSGNVSEWCMDLFDTYKSEPQTDPIGPNNGLRCVTRGGDLWEPYRCRVTNRAPYNPNDRNNITGFRLALLM